jgi:hypothetical protein
MGRYSLLRFKNFIEHETDWVVRLLDKVEPHVSGLFYGTIVVKD